MKIVVTPVTVPALLMIARMQLDITQIVQTRQDLEGPLLRQGLLQIRQDLEGPLLRQGLLQIRQDLEGLGLRRGLLQMRREGGVIAAITAAFRFIPPA